MHPGAIGLASGIDRMDLVSVFTGCAEEMMRLEDTLVGDSGISTRPAGTPDLYQKRTLPMKNSRRTSLTFAVKDGSRLAGAWRALRLAQTSYPTTATLSWTGV